MVSTRALSKGSEADTPKKPANATPKKHATVSGRIEKPKRATKTKRKKPGNVMSTEELEFEAELMKQVSLGETLFSYRLDPPWIQYAGACLMGLPAAIRNKIIDYILPIDQNSLQAIRAVRASDDEEGLERGPVFSCCYVHPILWTCRQLRYEYGNLFLSNNIFSWSVPQDWDPTQITRFAQHAASVGAPDFPLFMDLGTRQDGPGYKSYPRAPLAEEACRANLGRWMKTVYYGVETRALANAYPLRRDDGMIAHALHQARQYRLQGKSWDRLVESMDEAWEAFLERRELAEANLGKDVGAMTALYEASNQRLDKVRAASLGAGQVP